MPRQPAAGGTPVSGKKLIAILAAASVLLVGGGGAFRYFLLQAAAAKSEESGSEGAAQAAAEEEGAYVAYLPLAPAFVVNFQPAQKVKARFLSVEIEAMPTDAEARESIAMHMPAVRNAVILHLSKQNYDTLVTPEGKEQLRAEVLAEIQQVMSRTAQRTSVRDIYFTSFVMQ